MNDTTLLYWMLQADEIKGFIGGMSFIPGIGGVLALATCIVLFSTSLDSSCCEPRLFKKHAKQAALLCAFLFSASIFLNLLNCFIPSTRNLAVIAIAPRVANSSVVKKAVVVLPEKLLDLAISKLDHLQGDEPAEPKQDN